MPPAADPIAPASTRARPTGTRDMLLLGLMAAGFSTVDVITNNLVPLTCRHFTDSAFIIAAILATNRLFGFLVQPYVCWKSDYVRTSLGRRRPFLLFGLPITFLALLGVGLLPVLITGDARHTLAALSLVIIVNVLLQAVVDVNWGVLEPLYADTFLQEQLGRASSIRQIASQIVAFVMMSWVLGWADLHEFYPYLFSAAGVALAFALMLKIREQPAGPPPPPSRYSLVSHLRILVRDRDMARLAFICAANLFLPATLYLFTPLYVIDTLGLTKGELGRAQVLGPFLTIALAFPIGWLVDWLGAKWLMAAGFLLQAIAFAGLAFWVHDFWTLFAFMSVFGLAQIVALMPMTSMVFQYAAPAERGQVFSVVQFTRAASAFLITLLLGAAVERMDSSAPTPFRAHDLKSPTALAAKLQAADTPLLRDLHDRLSTETRHALTSPTPELPALLLTDLNAILRGPSLYSAERFAPSALSACTQTLVARSATTTTANDAGRIVLNRSLLQDAFPAELSRKIEYRLPYYVGLVLALAAAALALSARPGRFAKILRHPAIPTSAA